MISDMRQVSGRSKAGWLGWVLAVLVLIGIVSMLLTRCSPWSLVASSEPNNGKSALAEEAALRRELAQLKETLDTTRLRCLEMDSCDASTDVGRDHSDVETIREESGIDQTVPVIPDSDVCGRIEEKLDTCDTGDISVSLVWNSKDDLDLAIETPEGRVISWKKPEGPSGGRLNIDSNRDLDNRTKRPVENISWSSTALPPGRYRILARLHDLDESDSGGSEIPYTATLSRQGVVRPFTGKFVRADEGKPWKVIGSFSIP